MEVVFGSDASIRGPAAVPSTHVDEVCVNCHPKFEFLNESIVVHAIIWFVLTFAIYLVQIVQDRGKGNAQDSAHLCSDYNLHVQIIILKFKL